MSITLSSNFALITQLPLDARYIAVDITARNAIDAIQRFEGLMVYVVADQTVYHLKGGITNSDWEPIGTGAPGVNGKSVLSGPAEPDDITDGEDGDFWINLTTFDFFGPKGSVTPGEWEAAAFNMKGPQGDPGDADVFVEWEGVEILPQISGIDFVGPGISSVEDVGSGRVRVTVSGGGNAVDPDMPEIFGECDDPLDIAATGLRVASDHMSQEAMRQVVFVQGDGGPVDVTADPQIDRHTCIGAMLTIIGKSNTNTLTLQTGTGLVLNGIAVIGLFCALRLFWNGSAWIERRRNF